MSSFYFKKIKLHNQKADSPKVIEGAMLPISNHRELMSLEQLVIYS